MNKIDEDDMEELKNIMIMRDKKIQEYIHVKTAVQKPVQEQRKNNNIITNLFK